MTLMRFDPFRELDRLADQALTSARTPRTMPMEAFRRGDQFIVAIDVPGVNQEDVDVTVERNVIELSARRQPLRQAGDEVIIAASDYISPKELPGMRPRVLTFKPDNAVDEVLEYRVGEMDGMYDFRVGRV